MNRVLFLLVVCCALGACTKKHNNASRSTPEQPSPSMSPEMSAETSPPRRPPGVKRPAVMSASPEAPYRCAVDGDCRLTCRQGAVNRAWYKANEVKLKHCKDGCAGWGRRVRCVNKMCVAFRGQKRDNDCTRKKILWNR